jgi:hypothetical protein
VDFDEFEAIASAELQCLKNDCPNWEQQGTFKQQTRNAAKTCRRSADVHADAAKARIENKSTPSARHPFSHTCFTNNDKRTTNNNLNHRADRIELEWVCVIVSNPPTRAQQ